MAHGGTVPGASWLKCPRLRPDCALSNKALEVPWLANSPFLERGTGTNRSGSTPFGTTLAVRPLGSRYAVFRGLLSLLAG